MYCLSLGSLTSDSSNLFGTLDLGGGSTQITLNPIDQVIIQCTHYKEPMYFNLLLNVHNLTECLFQSILLAQVTINT